MITDFLEDFEKRKLFKDKLKKYITAMFMQSFKYSTFQKPFDMYQLMGYNIPNKIDNIVENEVGMLYDNFDNSDLTDDGRLRNFFETWLPKGAVINYFEGGTLDELVSREIINRLVKTLEVDVADARKLVIEHPTETQLFITGVLTKDELLNLIYHYPYRQKRRADMSFEEFKSKVQTRLNCTENALDFETLYGAFANQPKLTFDSFITHANLNVLVKNKNNLLVSSLDSTVALMVERVKKLRKYLESDDFIRSRFFNDYLEKRDDKISEKYNMPYNIDVLMARIIEIDTSAIDLWSLQLDDRAFREMLNNTSEEELAKLQGDWSVQEIIYFLGTETIFRILDNSLLIFR